MLLTSSGVVLIRFMFRLDVYQFSPWPSLKFLGWIFSSFHSSKRVKCPASYPKTDKLSFHPTKVISIAWAYLKSGISLLDDVIELVMRFRRQDSSRCHTILLVRHSLEFPERVSHKRLNEKRRTMTVMMLSISTTPLSPFSLHCRRWCMLRFLITPCRTSRRLCRRGICWWWVRGRETECLWRCKTSEAPSNLTKQLEMDEIRIKRVGKIPTTHNKRKRFTPLYIRVKVTHTNFPLDSLRPNLHIAMIIQNCFVTISRNHAGTETYSSHAQTNKLCPW